MLVIADPMPLMFEDCNFLPEALRNEYCNLRDVLMSLGLFDKLGGMVDITGTEMEPVYRRIFDLYTLNQVNKEAYITRRRVGKQVLARRFRGRE